MKMKKEKLKNLLKKSIIKIKESVLFVSEKELNEKKQKKKKKRKK